MKPRQPMNPFVQNALILLSSGLIASVLCAKVYGAQLPGDPADKAAPPPMQAAAQAPLPTANPVLALIRAQGPIGANGVQLAGAPQR